MPASSLSKEDKRLNIEGLILDVLSKYGGKRLVAGRDMTNLLNELTDLTYKIKQEGFLDD